MPERTAILLVLVAMAMLAVACDNSATQHSSTSSDASSGSSNDNTQRGYLTRYSNEVEFIRWTESSNDINGQLQRVYVTEESPVQIENESLGFTGTLEDSQVSLTFTILGASQTLTGTLENNTLTLTLPNQDGTLGTAKMQAATVEEYNRAVRTFRQDIEQQAAKQAEQQRLAEQKTAEIESRQEAVRKADEKVGEALNNLTGNWGGSVGDLQYEATKISGQLDNIAFDLGIMRDNYQLLQEAVSDKSNDCNIIENRYSADRDLQNVQDSVDSFPLSQLKEDVRGDVARTNKGIEDLQRAFNDLQEAVEANKSGTPDTQHGSEDVDEAISEAQQQIATTQAALHDAPAQLDTFKQEAEQLHQAAKELVADASCQV